jgi:FAD synthase
VEHFRGVVIRGKQLGRQLGFPTANIAIEGGAAGVYAARVLIGGEWRGAMANIDGRGLLEVHIFGFDGDLYGQQIEVELVRFIRPMRKFENIEELRQAIEKDKLRVLARSDY